jgi:hypothetical protein
LSGLGPVFYRRELSTPGHTRVFRGVNFKGTRRVELGVLVDGERRGGMQIDYTGRPIVLAAIEFARTSSATRECDRFADGRFEILVSVGGGAVLFTKLDGDGVAAGRPVNVRGDELDALEASLLWLAS